ncbi:MAG: hypothetical protein JWQ24_287 [Tardiphaga sp.]|nr:hypothetical protein [Tardiphaga sp.]
MTTGMAGVYLICTFIGFPVLWFSIREFARWMTYVNNRD